MEKKDTRLPERELGLGIVTDRVKRFYPKQQIKEGIKEELDGREIQIKTDPISKIPFAVWSDGTRPIQLFIRWYGFSYAFPNCEIHSKKYEEHLQETPKAVAVG